MRFLTAVTQHGDELYLGTLHHNYVAHLPMPADLRVPSDATGGAPGFAVRSGRPLVADSNKSSPSDGQGGDDAPAGHVEL